MKKRFLTKLTGIAVVTSLLLTATACSSQNATSDSGSEGNTSSEASSERDTIQVSVGRQTLQNVTFPDGDTYEDNAYIRMAENKLNIDITDEFEAYGDDYDRQVSLALSAGDIPDMMKVGTLDEVQELYENDLIADLTGVYEEYASDYLKSVYDSYEGRAMENVTFGLAAPPQRGQVVLTQSVILLMGLSPSSVGS